MTWSRAWTCSKETYGDFDQVALRVVARMDIGALNAPAIVKLAGVLA